MGSAAGTKPMSGGQLPPPQVSRRMQRWVEGDALVSATFAIVVMAAASTLPRLFADPVITQPIVVVAITTCLCGVVGRLLRLPFFVGAAVSGTASAVYAARFLFPSSVPSLNPYRLPVRELMSSIRLDWSQLSVTKAPLLDRPGFALSALAGIWIVSVLGDILAFTLRSPTEALVPPAVLVLVGAIVAPSGHRVVPATVFSCAAVLHIGSVTLAASRRRTWTDGRPPNLAPQLGRVAIVVGAAALATSFVIPRTGIAAGDALLDWRNGTARLPSKVTSPMVSIKRQLINLPNTVMFTASSTFASTGEAARTYWRLSTLTEFNGTTWTSSASYRNIEPTATLAEPAAGPSEPDLIQTVVIAELASSWLPMGYQAQSYETRTSPRGVSFGYDRRGNSILRSKPTKAGDSYTVRSVQATVEAGQAGRLFDSGWSPSDLTLPKNFSPRTRALARDIASASAPESTGSAASAPSAASAATPASPANLRALQKLQQFFRTQFVYSTEVPPPSKQDDLERFVFTDRAGYCEQFAGAFAAMARSMGIPARVAVGFTPGRLGPNGRFTITGKNSHAWPEAYVDGIGWLPFEPTPGRGIPGAEQYTGVADQDASETPVAAIDSTIPTTAVPPLATTAPPPLASVTDPATRSLTGSIWVAVAVASAAVVAALGGAFLVRRSRRRNPIENRWKRIRRRLKRHGLVAEPYETDVAFAQRAAASLSGTTVSLLPDLARRVEAHRYGPSDEWTAADTAAFLALAEQITFTTKAPT